MDRPVAADVRNKQIAWRIVTGILAVAVVAAAIGFLPRLVRPSLSREDLRTARVDAGPIEATISASGSVVPEVEQVLSSPIDARVVKILKKTGAVLRRGEPILDLDVSDSQLALDKLQQQLAIKENLETQKKLELENTLISRRSQLALKQIEVQSFEVALAKQQKLRAGGLNSEEQLREAAVALEKARVELKQLQESIANAERSTQAQIEGLKLEMDTVRKEAAQSGRQLERATTKADRDGVLTWVVAEEGALVRKGDIVARIADLSSFRVQAALSDIHASRLTPGMPAKVKLTETDYLDGTVTNVLPTIKDGVMTVHIGLADSAHKLLRANLRVDVFLVTDRRQRALRLRRGAYASAEGTHDVFVIRNNKAVRTPVKFGLFSFDVCEVTDGLMEGDEVVLSDMRDYAQLREIQLN